MASLKERDILARVILPVVGAQADRLPAGGVVGFLSVKGKQYDRQLMVVGRAVNGWMDSISPSELSDRHVAERFATRALENVSNDAECPMAWVMQAWGRAESYNTNRSAFWRVIKRVVGELGIADSSRNDWPSTLVWSNLYKVAPEKGGNPGNRLCALQLDGCAELLEVEIESYRPERVLFLTGLDWAQPFLERIVPNFQSVEASRVEAVGTIERPDGSETQVVVAVHPQGKGEDEWVRDVIGEFGVWPVENENTEPNVVRRHELVVPHPLSLPVYMISWDSMNISYWCIVIKARAEVIKSSGLLSWKTYTLLEPVLDWLAAEWLKAFGDETFELETHKEQLLNELAIKPTMLPRWVSSAIYLVLDFEVEIPELVKVAKKLSRPVEPKEIRDTAIEFAARLDRRLVGEWRPQAEQAIAKVLIGLKEIAEPGSTGASSYLLGLTSNP